MLLTGIEIVNRGIITPFKATKVDDGVTPSYGCDGMLYTLRGQCNFTLFKLFPLQSISFLTLEQIKMPLNCGGLLTVKSTYARKGIILVTNSPVDPGYEGYLTIRLFNSNNVGPALILDGSGGFIQLTVHRLSTTVNAYEGRWQNGNDKESSR